MHNPRRARALAVCTGAAFSRRPLARIAWGATPAHVRWRLDEHERQRAARGAELRARALGRGRALAVR